MAIKITNSFAKNVKFEGKQARYFDSLDNGFGLVVGATKKSFVVNIRVGGKMKLETIGYFPELSADSAREKARRVKAAMRDGLIAAESFSDLADRFFRHQERVLSANTIALYRRSRKKFADWESLPPGEISIDRCRARFAKITIDDGPIAANAAAIFCQRVLNWSIETGALPQTYANPWSRVKKNSRASRKRFLSKSEMRGYWQALEALEKEGRRWQMSFHALRYILLSGRRKDEALGLKWTMLDLEDGTVSYARTKTEPKVFSLASSVIKNLKDVPRVKGCDFVFASFGKGNSSVDEHTLYAVHLEICKRAGIEGVTVHDLRRTVGSQMRLAGADLADIAEVLGHQDLSTTKRHYAHINAKRAKERADQVSDIMLGGQADDD